MELLLNRKEIRGVLHYHVRWRGHTSADDEWLRAEELAHCPELVAEYDAAAPRRRGACRGRAGAPPAAPAAAAVAVAPPVALAGFWLATPAEVLTGAALVGWSILYRWPVQGWVLGKVVRVNRAAGFSHGVWYAWGSALGVAEVTSLLDPPSHGLEPAGWWVLPLPGLALALVGRP